MQTVKDTEMWNTHTHTHTFSLDPENMLTVKDTGHTHTLSLVHESMQTEKRLTERQDTPRSLDIQNMWTGCETRREFG